MYFWVIFWKYLFIVSTIGFGILAVWVIVWGIGDIQSLLSDAKGRIQDNPSNDTDKRNTHEA